jgi:hypothetical protein
VLDLLPVPHLPHLPQKHLQEMKSELEVLPFPKHLQERLNSALLSHLQQISCLKVGLLPHVEVKVGRNDGLHQNRYVLAEVAAD